jgi:hypothetical protein
MDPVCSHALPRADINAVHEYEMAFQYIGALTSVTRTEHARSRACDASMRCARTRALGTTLLATLLHRSNNIAVESR